jgi:outer membrane murein-binding lipoprotein Lpp
MFPTWQVHSSAIILTLALVITGCSDNSKTTELQRENAALRDKLAQLESSKAPLPQDNPAAPSHPPRAADRELRVPQAEASKLTPQRPPELVLKEQKLPPLVVVDGNDRYIKLLYDTEDAIAKIRASDATALEKAFAFRELGSNFFSGLAAVDKLTLVLKAERYQYVQSWDTYSVEGYHTIWPSKDNSPDLRICLAEKIGPKQLALGHSSGKSQGVSVEGGLGLKLPDRVAAKVKAGDLIYITGTPIVSSAYFQGLESAQASSSRAEGRVYWSCFHMFRIGSDPDAPGNGVFWFIRLGLRNARAFLNGDTELEITT